MWRAPACESCAHALVPAIADTQVRGLGPDELLADTLYGSDENHRVAAAEVVLIAPTSKGGEKKPLSEFQFDAAGNVTACPAGHAPTCCEPKKNAKYGAVFELERFQNCPRLSECPVLFTGPSLVRIGQFFPISGFFSFFLVPENGCAHGLATKTLRPS
ncbi:MAG: hypothetical protein R6V60_19890 [Desulfobacterales bacterium]